MTIVAVTLIALLLAWSLRVRRLGSTEQVLIVGTSPLARQLVEEFAGQPSGRQRLAGIVDDLDAQETDVAARRGRPLARLGEIITDLRPDRIVVAPPNGAAGCRCAPCSKRECGGSSSKTASSATNASPERFRSNR
jgi:hypothetical protein